MVPYLNAVEIANLSYCYPDGTKAIKNLDLKIKHQQRVAILGANGSGKTTLLYHLNGLLMPQDGTVKVMGSYVTKKDILSIRKQVGLLFDNPDNQLFSTTVLNDIAFGPRNLKLEDAEVSRRVKKAMAVVNIEDLCDKAPHNLSLGQKKRVAIAGILAMEPKLLLFDEPFSGLDPNSLRQVISILEGLHTQGCTLIISTHDVDIAYTWADEVIILNEGQLIAQGSADLLRDDKLTKQASLGIPILAGVFNGTGMYPHTVKEANSMLLTSQDSKSLRSCLL